MVSRWRALRAAGCLLAALSLVACGSESEDDDFPIPGSTGEACNPDAVGTDGCDMTSVCVVQTGICHADCAQETCDGTCSDYFSPIVERTLSVCFAKSETLPAGRTIAEPRPR